MVRFIVGLVLIVGIAAALFGAARTGLLPIGGEAEESVVVSPEAASNAEAKLAQLATSPETMLTAVELTSLFRFRPEIWGLAGVEDPQVQMSDETLRLSGRIPTDMIPTDPSLDELRMLFPEMVDLMIMGTVRTVSENRVILEVTGAEVAGLPLPRRFYAQVIERLGQNPNEPLPEGSFLLPLPAGLSEATVQDGVLLLRP